jgi:hypothetical protein
MKIMTIAGRALAAVALSLALLGTSSNASAAGAGLDASDLPTATRATLKAEIENARVTTPELFKAVADIAAHARDLDAGARARGVPLTMHFKPLGRRALFPMLEALVFDSHAAKDLPPSAASALHLGLLEAVGTIRDPRAIPVLAKVLELSRDDKTTRAASEALARIGTDDALRILTTVALQAKTDTGNDRERAILSGMHDARREGAARFLATRLKAADLETARVVAKSLGGVGNAWAWKTLSNQTEASATRSIAANALVDAYVRFGGDVREQAAKALLVIDDPGTPSLIAQAKKGASPELAAALDTLDQRFASNPTH